MLHNHSVYSVMDSINKIEGMVAKAKELNYPALGLSDHGTVSGLYTFHKECNKQGIKPVLGCELYFTPDVTVKDRDRHYHLCVFAKNETGYRELLELVTEGHRNFYYAPRVDYDILYKYRSENLFFTTACIGGILRENNIIFNKLSEFLDIYAELHTYNTDEQIVYNKRLLKNIKEERIIIATDAHYINKEDSEIHKKWMQLARKDAEKYYTGNNLYLMSEEDMYTYLSYLDKSFVTEVINRTKVLITQCENYKIKPEGEHYPIFPIENQKEYMESICYQMAKNDDEVERVAQEIEVLDKAGYTNYMLILQDIMKYAKDSGIRTGVGRGSCVASMVSYLLGITKINPLDYGLIFERFCHLERISPPDIDVDVMSTRRDEVISYIEKKYGHVNQVRTFGFTSVKSAIQRAGQSLTRNPKDIDDITRNISDIEEIKNDTELYELAKGFMGLLQNNGMHAAAVVIFPDNPTKFTAIERILDADGNEVFITAYDKDALEEMGLLKMDILGLDTLDVIEDVLCEIKDEELRKNIDNMTLSIDDKMTFDMIRRGETDGCFQIETKGMQEVIRKLQPTRIEEIMDLVALYRPGPKDAGMIDVYIENKKNNEINYIHEKLKSILSNTNGIILYQEQIQMICQELCGYNLGEGDVLRRIIGKKKEKEMRPALDDFINRGIMNGIPREIMIKISEQIETFALYGFNMGHSAAYGYTAYQTAYLKAHYPLQFWKARLNMCIGKVERTVQYIESARNDGIEILPPSVMESDHIWKIESTKLRMALNCVKGIKLQNMDNFVRQPDIISFINNNSLNKRILEGLAKSGCFGEKVGENLSIIDWKKLQKTGPKKSQNMTFETYISQFPINETDLSISQIEVLGMTFVKNIFEKFDLSLVNGATISYGLCVSFKSRLDKNGRKMAFVGMTDKNGTKEYVMFWRNFRELKTGTVYLFNHNKTIITDITQPRLLTKR